MWLSKHYTQANVPPYTFKEWDVFHAHLTVSVLICSYDSQLQNIMS